MTGPFLEIRGIRKEYGKIVAVEDVNLTVERGELVTFLGPSGSGKSTTLYILAGFEKPTNGDIRLEGTSLLATPSHQRNIGMVFQRYTLFPHLSVGENIAFSAARQALAEGGDRRKGEAHARARAARGIRGSKAVDDVGRPAAACRPRPGPCLRSSDPAHGRAPVGFSTRSFAMSCSTRSGGSIIRPTSRFST